MSVRTTCVCYNWNKYVCCSTSFSHSNIIHSVYSVIVHIYSVQIYVDVCVTGCQGKSLGEYRIIKRLGSGDSGNVYLVKRKSSGGPGYDRLVIVVKVAQRRWRNVELKVFHRTVGHTYLVQLVSFFQTWVCSSYLNVCVFRQLLILKFTMTFNM
jgi:serine/threonine protein kinase